MPPTHRSRFRRSTRTELPDSGDGSRWSGPRSLPGPSIRWHSATRACPCEVRFLAGERADRHPDSGQRPYVGVEVVNPSERSHIGSARPHGDAYSGPACEGERQLQHHGRGLDGRRSGRRGRSRRGRSARPTTKAAPQRDDILRSGGPSGGWNLSVERRLRGDHGSNSYRLGHRIGLGRPKCVPRQAQQRNIVDRSGQRLADPPDRRPRLRLRLCGWLAARHSEEAHDSNHEHHLAPDA